MRLAWISALQSALSQLVTSLAVLAVLWVAVPLVGAGQLSGVALAVVVLAALDSFEAVAPLSLAAHNLRTSLPATTALPSKWPTGVRRWSIRSNRCRPE